MNSVTWEVGQFRNWNLVDEATARFELLSAHPPGSLPSLPSIESTAQQHHDRVPSLLSQRNDWIERSCPPGRKVARDRGQQHEQQAGECDDDRIEP
jgi:hypothetical protein